MSENRVFSNDFWNKPIVIFVLGGLIAFGTNYMSSQSREASNAIRIASLEEYRAEHSKNSVTRSDLTRVENSLRDTQRSYVTKDEFSQFTNSMLRAVEEVRDELRDRRARTNSWR